MIESLIPFQVGDAFVLCDAGGGTVDLISYEITKLDPLELRELVPGKGQISSSLKKIGVLLITALRWFSWISHDQ